MTVQQREAGLQPASLDDDPEEIQEWREALAASVEAHGDARAQVLLRALRDEAARLGVSWRPALASAYRNTIAPENEPPFPGDIEMEQRIASFIRWNALAMVVRANAAYGALGGHIASFASAAELFEVGLNHFFRGPDAAGGGDLVYFQAHSAPGIYARAFLEGRLAEADLERYRQEALAPGLSSYPHPRLMPDFWQVPTSSMGLGPINAVYQARFMRYLSHRGLADTSGRRVWGIFGDGEMDEPDSIAALTLAARERLDNLTFIVNCNLQRLDGPVRGNAQIVSELETLFTGAGWNVIKVLWGSEWDALFSRDTSGALDRALSATTDGMFQTLGANDGAFNLSRFFGQSPELAALVSELDAPAVDGLRRGGHDMRKLHAAYAAAAAFEGAPTVILAKTKKGYGMGDAGESRMTAHQAKKLDTHALRAFRDRFELPIADADVDALRFFHPGEDSPEAAYLRARRAELGGALPQRRTVAPAVPVPPAASHAAFALDAGGKEMSTTMAAVRQLGNLLKDRDLGPRLVPIVADEARTFGMAGLFRQAGIYAPEGQLYEPEDASSLMSYREASNGQILQEGITEAGSIGSWGAAGTAYSTHGLAMLPVFIFYSMFGFQRVGDHIWAAADQCARGFLLGATAGRTTLAGEGLQHQDGHSHMAAAAVPACRAYDPAYAYEVAVILEAGMQAMLERQEDVFYYLTLTNESYPQPSLPENAREGIIKGMYPVLAPETGEADIRLLGSGALLPEVRAAAALLEADYDATSEVWSVTSFSELARDAYETERRNRLNPGAGTQPYVATCLNGTRPVVAATDYVRAYPSLISPFLMAPFVALGTDGFGRSDTREALRRFFEVDRYHIAVSALTALGRTDDAASAIARYGIDQAATAPWRR